MQHNTLGLFLKAQLSTIAVCNYASFEWGRVNFLHSSWYGAMFWIYDESYVDNSRDVLVTAQKCLQSQGLFWSSPCPSSKEGSGTQEV